MPQVDIVVSNKLGLHARAAAKLTQLASRFSSEIYIAKGTRRVNAKSIMGVMMLAAEKGAKVVVETAGSDEQAAMEVLFKLIGNKFGEGE